MSRIAAGTGVPVASERDDTAAANATTAPTTTVTNGPYPSAPCSVTSAMKVAAAAHQRAAGRAVVSGSTGCRGCRFGLGARRPGRGRRAPSTAPPRRCRGSVSDSPSSITAITSAPERSPCSSAQRARPASASGSPVPVRARTTMRRSASWRWSWTTSSPDRRVDAQCTGLVAVALAPRPYAVDLTGDRTRRACHLAAEVGRRPLRLDPTQDACAALRRARRLATRTSRRHQTAPVTPPDRTRDRERVDGASPLGDRARVHAVTPRPSGREHGLAVAANLDPHRHRAIGPRHGSGNSAPAVTIAGTTTSPTHTLRSAR